MFNLMSDFYDNVVKSTFYNDLNEKDYCIILYNEDHEIKGFSTQKLITLYVADRTIHGVFSGDTIIHKDYWGSMELYKGFIEKAMEYESKYDNFYWFLISKGYKTYRMLPLFFIEFYPNCKKVTPEFEQLIMHSFGKSRYPHEYDLNSGVIKYKGTKDSLKKGVADIGQKQLNDKDIAFFLEANPGFNKGDDIVCLASLKKNNFKTTFMRLFVGG
ncbi:MAG: hypothetical protein KBH06_06310 [Spirochaetes bacterium]|nr:hypothetical protein [Spirochaetota bacterium]